MEEEEDVVWGVSGGYWEVKEMGGLLRVHTQRSLRVRTVRW